MVAASAVLLALGLSGLVVALRRRRAYDTPVTRGDPDHVVRDSIPFGTALSAPVPMLAIQAVSTLRLASRHLRQSARVLGVLGAVMTPGYLLERLVRHRLTASGWDPLETPIAAGGLVFAVVMAVLGLKSADD